MTDNAPDYKNNLVFEPEMTWPELVEKAKKLGYELSNDYKGMFLYKHYIKFFYDGDITVVVQKGYNLTDTWFSYNRTPSQMYQIMKALEN